VLRPHGHIYTTGIYVCHCLLSLEFHLYRQVIRLAQDKAIILLQNTMGVKTLSNIQLIEDGNNLIVAKCNTESRLSTCKAVHVELSTHRKQHVDGDM